MPTQMRLLTTRELAALARVPTHRIDHWCQNLPTLPRPRMRRRDSGAGRVRMWTEREAAEYVIVARLVRYGFTATALGRYTPQARARMLHVLDSVFDNAAEGIAPQPTARELQLRDARTRARVVLDLLATDDDLTDPAAGQAWFRRLGDAARQLAAVAR
jgi:hypothetical protein